MRPDNAKNCKILALMVICVLILSGFTTLIQIGPAYAQSSDEGIEYAGRQEFIIQISEDVCGDGLKTEEKMVYDFTFRVMPDGTISGNGTYNKNLAVNGDSYHYDGNVRVEGRISSAPLAAILVTPEDYGGYLTYGVSVEDEYIIEERHSATPESPEPPLIELKPGFKQVITSSGKYAIPLPFDCTRRTGEYTISYTITISGPPIKFVIKGKVSSIDRDGKTIPLSESVIVLGNYKDMKQEDGLLTKLSDGKGQQPFEQKKMTNNDGTYEFTYTGGTASGEGSDSQLPKLVVTSLLWYDGDGKFAVVNGDLVDGRRIPVYQTLCVSAEKQKDDCLKWEKNSSNENLYEAEVNFVYGSQETYDRHYYTMLSEKWDPASAKTIPNLMRDAGIAYTDSYTAIKYFESFKAIAGNSLPPVTVTVRDNDDGICKSGKAYAFYDETRTEPFGDLGTYLDKVDAKGGGIALCDDKKDASANYVTAYTIWHEFSHYWQEDFYKPGTPSCCVEKNHGGYTNSKTDDSLVEAFAEFGALLIAEKAGKTPGFYKYPDHEIFFEEDYKVWGENVQVHIDANGKNEVTWGKVDSKHEEFAIGGILWDLHDPGIEINLKQKTGVDSTTLEDVWSELSKVYPTPTDSVSLSDKEIIKIIADKKPLSLVDLYNAFSGAVKKEELDQIFIEHGAFDDTINRNLIHDVGEKVGPTGSSTGPERMVRLTPRPDLPGSYITTNNNSTLEISFVHEEPFSNYDYSYRVDTIANEPVYFEMPPSYYPSKAIISQVSSPDGEVIQSNIATIDSDEYWNYIRSEPQKDEVFKTIPVQPIVLSEGDSSENIKETTAENIGEEVIGTSGGGSGSSTSKCLIATAAFGSELTPQVQFLRNFRDNHILSTTAGSSFMNVFNAWYYSFSPYVADYEREQPWLQQSVKVAIYPLLGILTISEKAYSVIPGDYGTLLAGLATSSMIGAVYFSPLALSVKQVRNSRAIPRLALYLIVGVSIALLASILAGNQTALMLTTSAFVLGIVIMAAVISAKMIVKAAKIFQRLT